MDDVTLPSGATVTLRDKLKGKDKFAVQEAMKMSLDTSTGMQESTGAVISAMRNELLKLVIEHWTLDLALPSADTGSLGELDIDDYNALSDAVQPLMDKILNVSVPNRSAQSAS